MAWRGVGSNLYILSIIGQIFRRAILNAPVVSWDLNFGLGGELHRVTVHEGTASLKTDPHATTHSLIGGWSKFSHLI